MDRLRFISIFFIAFIAFFFFGCTIPRTITFDTTIPNEQISTIVIPNELTVVKFNEETVRWRRGELSNVANVRIPAGEHVLIVDYLSTTTRGTIRTTRRSEGMEVRFDFRPGVTYELYPTTGFGVAGGVMGTVMTIAVREQERR